VNCGRPIPLEAIRPAGPFPCPTCGTLLVASQYYASLAILVSMAFAAMVFAALGFRGESLYYGLILAFIPVIFFAANVFKYIIPPPIEPYETNLHLD
jgi:hypothetical protein